MCELSLGNKKKVSIIQALFKKANIIILDEPTTALDVTVQAQIIDLLRVLNEKCGVGRLVISHDLRVVRRVCKKVAVMYKGKIVEQGNTENVFNSPQHQYTKKLISAVTSRIKAHV